MFGRFFYGQCSLAEAFWKFSFLGLAVSGFVTRLLMIFLKQSAGYETRYLQVLWNNISLLSMNPAAFTWLFSMVNPPSHVSTATAFSST